MKGPAPPRADSVVERRHVGKGVGSGRSPRGRPQVRRETPAMQLGASHAPRATRSQAAPAQLATGAATLSSPDLLMQVLHSVGQPELLRLRACSKEWRAFVAFAVREHPKCHTISIVGAPPRRIKALAQVFGAGCRRLEAKLHNDQGRAVFFKDTLHFVKSTCGRLAELDIEEGAPLSCANVLALCKEAPRLKVLRGLRELCSDGRGRYGSDILKAPLFVRHEATGKKSGPIWRADALEDNIPYQIAQRCPLLEVVELPTQPFDDGRGRGEGRGNRLKSPGESYARHFPNLTSLQFTTGDLNYEIHMRTALATIAECPKVTTLDFNNCRLTGNVLLELTRPYAEQLTTLILEEASGFSADTLIACVRQCVALEKLDIKASTVEGDGLSVPMCVQLATALRTIKSLDLSCLHWVTDVTAPALFSRLECLEELVLGFLDVGPDTVRAIATSPFAERITSLKVECTDRHVESQDMSYVLHSCPNLAHFEWEGDVTYDDGVLICLSHEALKSIREVIALRGGTCEMAWTEQTRDADDPYVMNGDWYTDGPYLGNDTIDEEYYDEVPAEWFQK